MGRRYNNVQAATMTQLVNMICLRVPCPNCLAPAGQSCVTVSGANPGMPTPQFHSARDEAGRKQYETIRSALETQPCPLCGKAIGSAYDNRWHTCLPMKAEWWQIAGAIAADCVCGARAGEPCQPATPGITYRVATHMADGVGYAVHAIRIPGHIDR